MLSETVESLVVWRVELHLPGEAVLHLLCDGRTTLQAIFALRHGEVLELLTVLSLL